MTIDNYDYPKHSFDSKSKPHHPSPRPLLPLPTGEGWGGALLLDSIDAAYLHLISEAPAERKTDIGHSRKAFLAYAERLQQVMQALPEDLRERYSSIVALRLQKMQQHLQKSTTDN